VRTKKRYLLSTKISTQKFQIKQNFQIKRMNFKSKQSNSFEPLFLKQLIPFYFIWIKHLFSLYSTLWLII